MSDVVLASAGGIVFLLTAWASLVFGYQVFQNMWETDQAASPAPARFPTDDPAVSLVAVDATESEGVRPIELVHPIAPVA